MGSQGSRLDLSVGTVWIFESVFVKAKPPLKRGKKMIQKR
jgi:hypothetical protein